MSGAGTGDSITGMHKFNYLNNIRDKNSLH